MTEQVRVRFERDVSASKISKRVVSIGLKTLSMCAFGC
jgi:hypothetical protein